MKPINRFYWNATLFVAMISTVILFYSESEFRGGSLIYNFAIELWFVWLGILISSKINIHSWIRKVLVIGSIGLFCLLSDYNLILDNIIFLGRLGLIRYLILFMLGLGICLRAEENKRFKESLFLFVSFFMIYAFMNFVERYGGAYFICEDIDLMKLISRYGKILPLAAGIYYCIRLSFSDKVLKFMSMQNVPAVLSTLIAVFGIYSISMWLSLIKSGYTLNLHYLFIFPVVMLTVIFVLEKLFSKYKKTSD